MDPNRTLLEKAAKRKIKAVAREESPTADALFSMLRIRRDRWDHETWLKVLEAVDRSELTVGEWLESQPKVGDSA